MGGSVGAGAGGSVGAGTGGSVGATTGGSVGATTGASVGGSGREMSTAAPLPSVDPCANLMGLPANPYEESRERLIASRQEEVAGTEEKVKGNVSPSITISSTPATEAL